MFINNILFFFKYLETTKVSTKILNFYFILSTCLFFNINKIGIDIFEVNCNLFFLKIAKLKIEIFKLNFYF